MNIPNQTQLKLKHKSKLIYIMILMLYGFGINVYASAEPNEKITVTGIVTSSEDYAPLPGVNIVLKGTLVGVTSNFDGKYSIEVPSSGATLVFTYLGFKTKEIPVLNETTINVALDPEIQSLNEVVVVGYGQKKKVSLIGAIEQVRAEVFEDRAITNPALALQGQTPGLVVTRTSPRPGNEGLGLQIRGATSVNGGDPLVIIDGAPVTNSREFYQMNPDDIKSISVLKDGSASIYGSRASNGVILITTKRGKGEMKIEYKGTYRYNTIGIRPPVPSMQQYATLWLEAIDQDGATANYWGWDSRENLERMQAGEEGIYSTSLWGDVFIGEANRFDELFGDSESYQHNFSLSGSEEKTKYRLSAAIADNRGALKTAYDGQKQSNIRFNYDYDINEKLKLQTGVTYQRAKNSGPSTGLDESSGSYDPPLFPAKNPYGQWYANFNTAGNRNATAATSDGGRKNFVEDLMKLYLNGTYTIIEGLEFKANATINKFNSRLDEYRFTIQPYEWKGKISSERINTTSIIKGETNNTIYQNYGAFLNYKHTFKEAHNLALMIGQTAELQKYQLLTAERKGIQDLGVYDLKVASVDNITNDGGSGHWGIYSTIGRFNYDYKGKYLIELVGRRDGSSRFAEGYKYSNFGSVTGGWVVSSETFLQDFFIDYLKIRGSYGTSGNQVGIGLQDYVSQISNASITFGTTPALQNRARVNGLTSLTRTWEEVKMENIGLDFRVLQHRLTGSFDIYRKTNNGMLIDIIYPNVLGGTAPKSNSGQLETKGWEAVLSWNDKKGDFSYNVSVNMSDSKNNLIKMEGSTEFAAGLVPTREGFPLNSYFLYKTDGLFQSQAEVDSYYATFTAVKQGELPLELDNNQAIRVGDTKKIDSDGNGYIDDVGSDGDSGDAVYMGDAAPHYVYGINLGAAYKGFDFNAFFQGVLKQNVLRTGFMQYPFYEIWTNQTTAYLGKTWTPENTSAEYPRMTTNTTRSAYNWANNDFLLQNNRYLRLKNIVLGYTLDESISEKIGMDKIRFYFSGNDLFEITSVKDGYDPEFGDSTQSIYPFSRTYALGINLTF